MVAESKRSVCLEMGEQRDTGERAAKGHKEISGADGCFHYVSCGGNSTGGYIRQNLPKCTW